MSSCLRTSPSCSQAYRACGHSCCLDARLGLSLRLRRLQPRPPPGQTPPWPALAWAGSGSGRRTPCHVRRAASSLGDRGAMSLGGRIRRGRLRAGVTARLALTPLPTHPIAKEKQAAAEEEGASAVIPSGCRPGGPVHMPCAPVLLPSMASGLGPEWGSSPQFSPVCGVPAAFGLRFPPANPAAVRVISPILGHPGCHVALSSYKCLQNDTGNEH